MSNEKQLNVDEGWKAQVEREKELLKEQPLESLSGKKQEPTAPAASPESRPVPPASQQRDIEPPQTASHEPPPPPPASFEFLVASLATQAMACLGQIPDDDGKPLAVNLPYAKHFIDLLGVIEDKTQNNLDNREAAYIKGALHQLRIQFVESSRG